MLKKCDMIVFRELKNKLNVIDALGTAMKVPIIFGNEQRLSAMSQCGAWEKEEEEKFVLPCACFYPVSYNPVATTLRSPNNGVAINYRCKIWMLLMDHANQLIEQLIVEPKKTTELGGELVLNSITNNLDDKSIDSMEEAKLIVLTCSFVFTIELKQLCEKQNGK
jgi:hypothetical protein